MIDIIFFVDVFFFFVCGFELGCDDRFGNLYGDLDGFVLCDDIGGGMFIVFSGVLELLLLLFDFSICFFGDVIGGKRLLEFFFLICFCFFVCFVLFGILVFIVF